MTELKFSGLSKALEPGCREYSHKQAESETVGEPNPVALWSPTPISTGLALVIRMAPRIETGVVEVCQYARLGEAVAATYRAFEVQVTLPCCGANGGGVRLRLSEDAGWATAHKISSIWNGDGLPRLEDRYENDPWGGWITARVLGGLLVQANGYLLLGDQEGREFGWERVGRLNEARQPRRINSQSGEVEGLTTGRRHLFDAPGELEWVEVALREGMAGESLI